MGLFDGTALERPVLCERCSLDVKQCQCEPLKPGEQRVAPEKQAIRVRVEKRKRGKIVTVADGFTGSESQRQETLTSLKGQCGAGGTLKDGIVEIQGDHRERVVEYLKQQGFKCK